MSLTGIKDLDNIIYKYLHNMQLSEVMEDIKKHHEDFDEYDSDDEEYGSFCNGLIEQHQSRIWENIVNNY